MFDAKVRESWKDAEVTERMKRTSKQERGLHASWLFCLAEVERRKLFSELSYSSLFDYVVNALHYAEGTAGKRIQVMRTAEKFPVIYSLIEQGSICLTHVSLLSRHLTEENHAELLTKIQGMSTRKVEELIVSLYPKPEVKETVRRLPTPTPKAVPALTLAPPPAPRPEKVEPLSPARVAWHYSSNVATREKFEKARDLLRHKFPQGRAEDIMDFALDVLLEKLNPERAARARVVPPSDKNTRYIPRRIKVEVWKRDGGQCAYKSPDGRRCEARGALQFDHVKPWALGGRSDDAENLRLLCASHNRWRAEKTFGRFKNTAT